MDLDHLIDLCARYIEGNGKNICQLPGLSVFQRDVESKIEAFIYEPVLCLILQGSKVTSIGDQMVELRPGDALLVSHDLPVVSRITKASVEEPYLALILSIDLGLVRSLYEQVGDTMTQVSDARSLSVGPAGQAWSAPLARYFELMHNSLDVRVLGPSLLREIHYRLLLSPIGGMLRNLLIADSHASRVGKAIGQLRAGFRTQIAVSDLAKTAGMSVSSFHEYFKLVTGTTPLQYQKDLRLIEAKALLVGGNYSVSQVAFAVGYESPTHFSRDYRRKFGAAPSKETNMAPATSQDVIPALG